MCSYAVWSPCGQFITACFNDTVQIWDSNTLERISILNPPSNYVALYPVFLTFSPSGYFLAYAFSYFLRLAISLASVTILMSLPSEAAGFYVCIWGVKTGVITNNIKHQEPLEFVFSGNYRTAALLWKDGTFHIYDGPNGTCIYKDKLMPSADFLLGSQWTHEESLQFPTIVKNNGKLVVSI